MATTAAFKLTGTVAGLAEGSDQVSVSVTNSTAVGITQTVNLTSGIAGASTLAVPPDARFCLIIPPSTNPSTNPIHIGNSTADSTGHLTLASTGMSFFTVTTAFTSVVLWSSAIISSTVAGGEGVRVSFY